ncbi:MAG: NAD(P)-dependent oxidoreductase [Lachnospiraceae bacterium]|nr:NAD(P)-dependent oxidoreductase [bacterium]MDY5517413.1 NAD(P)-dependent oxidoreductase [Lachnospiraceae bacterium]
MEILLVGGAGSFMEALVGKIKKEGHRIYVLTGAEHPVAEYPHVFEKYNFAYDNDCIKEICESVNPDVVVFMGAYDTNFSFGPKKKDAVAYLAGLLNVLSAVASIGRAKFLYLSSEEVYQVSQSTDIRELDPVTAADDWSLAIAQGEEMCLNYHYNKGLDVVIMRMDHIYEIPKRLSDIHELCGLMCLEAFRSGELHGSEGVRFSMLFVDDAAEFINQVLRRREHRWPLYNVSSGEVISSMALAEKIQKLFPQGKIRVMQETEEADISIVLNSRPFAEEFGLRIFHPIDEVVPRIVKYMKQHKTDFSLKQSKRETIVSKVMSTFGQVLLTLLPFFENLVCFIPFFMLNNRAVGSEYFEKLDFFLLYVLLFAVVYGQQQATFSAILAVAGYFFRQMYDRTGFEILLDYNTYVWIAQLFIVGLVVGYMRDHIHTLEQDSRHEIDFLSDQLVDIQDINQSNVRMKNVLETQIVNQNDSFGKIYEITSTLERYAPEEVLFYAAEVVSKLVDSEDVAIYTVANRSYARLFSATSKQARCLGNSIEYVKYEKMYECLKNRKVFINREMDEQYPLMANAIYSEDEMELILMVWGIPWERMTLGQANMLVIIGYLIQNAVVRANRYLAALEQQRYLEGTNILEAEAFTSLASAYLVAYRKGLTECAFIRIQVSADQVQEAGNALSKLMRQSDFIGQLKDGGLYALLSNTSKSDASFVIKRFQEAGYESRVVEEIDL